MDSPATITPAERAAKWRGLGDVIASATKAVGIMPCSGCARRQELLNKAVPFTISLPNDLKTSTHSSNATSPTQTSD